MSLWIIQPFFVAIFFASAYSVDPPPYRTCPDVNGSVLISPTVIGRKWAGWGTSLAWWANWAGGLSLSDRDTLLDLLFHKRKGLGLNIARYNIGGGGWKSVTDYPQFKGALQYRLMPGFKPTWDSPYNWSNDANQRAILLGAKSRGVNFIEAFSNSPPGWMTVSGSVTGADSAYQDNLAPGNYSNFAGYLSDVVKAYKKLYNIRFKTLEPFNEPLSSQWVKGNKQEGCHFSVKSMAMFIPLLSQHLTVKRLITEVVAADTLLRDGPKVFRAFEESDFNYLMHLNVHSYEKRKMMFNFSRQFLSRKKMAAVGTWNGKQLMVSEGGPFLMQGSEFDVALGLAYVIMMDINLMKVSGWSYWQAVEDYVPQPYWGLIFANLTSSGSLRYRIRPQYYVMMQFTRWLTPGSFPLKIDSSCGYGMVAASDAMRLQVIIIAANYLYELQSVSVKLLYGTIGDKGSWMAAYRTSESENYTLIDNRTVEFPFKGDLVLTPRSITTFIFGNVGYSLHVLVGVPLG